MPVDVKPVIYQLVVRYFGNINPTNRRDGTREVNGCGRFADINPAALRAIRELGATHVWLTGVLRQATLTNHSALGIPPDHPDVVKGLAGSFYAVKDCFDVCPDYAENPADRLAEFDALLGRVHDAGLKALIDFIPNHVARGYRSVVRPDLDFGAGDDTTKFFHPQNHFFYVVDPPGQPLRLEKPEAWCPPGVTFDGGYPAEDGSPGRPAKATGNNVATASPGVFDWYETVKLNYGWDFVAKAGHYAPRPRTWDVMDAVLAHWQALGVDGFRCDFAHYVPPEAWAFLVDRARERDPAAYFMAEAYPWAGSGDPITDRRQLTDAGFDAVYDDDSYNRLKEVYQGSGGQDDYARSAAAASAAARRRVVRYLENHDERRVASPVTRDEGPAECGFGSPAAGYQLAPLQLLSHPGPVLVLNGQESGEPGAGHEGYGGEDGRTTLFDYWCMPEHAKWVTGHRYDGGQLSADVLALRRFYAALLELCQDPAVRADGYWGLKYWNRPDRFADCPDALYTFARFADGGGRLLLVVTNFNVEAATEGRVRVPDELAAVAGLRPEVTVRLRLDEGGTRDVAVVQVSRDALATEGFAVRVPGQRSYVYEIS
ncbi:MAG: alpha-amylase [Phycisphaerales bacterium]|nr:alpha-amylase [Phycisphaerales bacterium]